MTIKIEKGIPLKGRGRGTGRPPRLPWRKMDVGDSVFVPAADKAAARRLQRALSARAADHRRAGGGKFTTRLVEGGVRVWRTD